MKTLVKNYTFSPSTKQITITNLTAVRLEQLLVITNVTDNIIIYNFADPSLGATVSGNVITLDYNTVGMDAADSLQIFLDVENYTDLEVLGNVMIDGFASVVSQLESMKTAQGIPTPTGMLRTTNTAGYLDSVTALTLIDGYYQRMQLWALTNTSAASLRSQIKVYSGNI